MRARASWIVLISTLVAAAPAAAQSATRSWALQDQFGATVDIRIGAGKAAVILVSEKREAAEEIAAWGKELAPLPASASVFRVANLKAIPFFVPKGSVSKDLKENYSSMSLALDWKGAISAALDAPKRETAVLVFGPDGAELGRVAGQASPSGASRVRELLARIK